MIKAFCAVLVTKNFKEQLTFYKEVIGLTEFFNQDNTAGLGVNNQLHIVLRIEDNPESHHLKENKGPIILTFQINSGDRDALLSRIENGGYKIRDKLELPNYGSEYIFIEDFDGNELCLDVKG
ncbi:VOC family protein [Legionella sp. W05-934-2]|jgi:catechol-2,3-dioxygenase|uniref:VOC family protein n=1 Tax=Legionella sp. W05-934-2 TaxID=1198649 RepID=UPI0034618A33